MSSARDHIVVVDDQLPLAADILPAGCVIRVNASDVSNTFLRTCKATAMLIRSTTHVTYDLLRDTHVTFVGSATAGMDHLEPALLHDRNIRVVGAPGCNANAVAEYVMIWLQHLDADPSTVLGIVGFGNVGQRLARYAVSRGHRVLVNDPPLAELGYRFPDCVEYTSLDHLIEHSNVISIHTPYSTSGPHATHHLINSERVEHLQHGTLVICTRWNRS